MTPIESHLQEQWMEDDDLSETPLGDVVQSNLLRLHKKISGLVRFVSAPCNQEALSKIVPLDKVVGFIMKIRFLAAKDAVNNDISDEFIQTSAALENLVATARGRRNSDLSIENLVHESRSSEGR